MFRRTYLAGSLTVLAGAKAGCIARRRPSSRRSTRPPPTTVESEATNGDGGPGSVEDIKLYNETDDTLTVTVTVRPIPEDAPMRANTESDEVSDQRDLSGQPPVISETFELEPGTDGRKVYPNPITSRDAYEIRVEVEGGPTGTYDWVDEYDDALGVLVFIRADGIEFAAIEA